MDVGQDLHEEAISNRDVLLLQVKQMAALARAAFRASQTLVSSISAGFCSARVCTCGWEGIEALCIQQERVEQTVNTDNRPPSELASVGDAPVISYGDL